MKILYVIILLAIVFSACAKKDDSYYDRANKASEKSLQSLERDAK